MPKDVKNKTGEDRWVPALAREVTAGELVKDVPDEIADSLGEQVDNWEVRKAKTAPAADKVEE